MEKIYLADRNVVLVIGVDLGILLRCEAGKMLEIVDEMGLVVKAAIDGDHSPIYVCRGIDGPYRFLKSHYFQIRFRRNPDLFAKHLGKVLLRIADL